MPTNKGDNTTMTCTAATKPFPWKCSHCRCRSVVPALVDYTTEVEHDGRAYTITVPGLEVPRCDSCGEMILDDAANRRISDTFREHIGLLNPSQIREHRKALGLTQKQVARVLGLAEATLSRWETGAQIQQRALDKLLRLFFASETVRELLGDESRLVQSGTADPSGNSSDDDPTCDTPVLADSRSSRDAKRAARLSRIAAMLDELPEEREAAVFAHLSSFVELLREKRPSSPAGKP